MKVDAASVAPGSWRAWHDPSAPLRVGVSACLLGESVRYDHGHCRDPYLNDVLAPFVEWVSVCPEVELGLGVPRPTIRLVDEGQGTRLVVPSTGEDLTERMEAFAEARLDALDALRLDGYVLKQSSPSCGLGRLSVYRGGGRLHRQGVGRFAAALVRRHPGLPVEEEGRLVDADRRENFVVRLFCRNRWRRLLRRGRDRGGLVAFHAAHALLLRAHDERGCRELGRLVGGAGGLSDAELFTRYGRLLQETQRHRATPRKHARVLQHALGHLKRVLDPGEEREILGAIEDFRRGLLPLGVPLALLRSSVRKHGLEALEGQLYLDPHPHELALRDLA